MKNENLPDAEAGEDGRTFTGEATKGAATIGAATGGSGPGMIWVPIGALAMPDESEQMTAPEKGDRVTMQVEGTISDIQGEQVCVTPEAVNGQNLAEAQKEQQPELSPEQQDAQEYSALQDSAQKQVL